MRAVLVSLCLIFARCAQGFQVIQGNLTKARLVENDDRKGSLVFVFDTTGSMYNDLRQLREGAEMILNTALEESNVIDDFVFVPFHDPAVGPATVTKDKTVFKSALNIVRVYGGGDCPEKSLGGIQLALNVSRPRSYIYVFTDATASDHRLVAKVLDMIQRKQSQVVFILTGHCNDLHKPTYKVYHQIASASSGQVFNLNKTNVHKLLDFVRSSIKGRKVNLASAVRPAGYNYTQGIQVDRMIGEVTVSVSGAKPQIEVVNPSGEKLTGPPKLVTTLDLSEIMIVKVLDPEPGNWSITVGSEKDYSVKVVGLSDLTFNHGFSVVKPATMSETSYRPLQGTYNHMMISLTKTDIPVDIQYAQILDLEGKTIFEVPLREIDSKNKIYLADAFVPPDDFFYISINGQDEYHQDLRRIGTTAVQAKAPDAPYLIAPEKVQARHHERVTLSCDIDSLVPVTAMWTKDTRRIQDQVNSLQSTTVEYDIEDMDESHVGTYRCVARNVAGMSRAVTELELIVDPPQVTISPVNTTVTVDEELMISCAVVSEALLSHARIVFTSIERRNQTEFKLAPAVDGFYTFNQTIPRVAESDGGEYSCVAANRGGERKQSSFITIQVQPIVQIIGPHSLSRRLHSDVQFVCSVENARTVQWKDRSGDIVQQNDVNGTYMSVLDVKNVTSGGSWSCVAMRDSYVASDSIQLEVLMKPVVQIEGDKNITLINGTTHTVTCTVVAKPAPRILWHMETERFLNHTVTVLDDNTYKSVLTLDSTKEQVNGTYFCFGENSEGINQDSITVNVRRKMKLLEGFTDQSVELYSQLDFHCKVDAYPPATITWKHNGTALVINENINVSEDNSTLFLLKVDFDNLGVYSCMADNGYESVEANGTLSVHGLESPVISKEPLTKKIKKGESAILTCRVLKGNPEPLVKWEFSIGSSQNFTKLPRDVVIHEDRYEIEIPSVDVDHAGTYRCVAKNAIGRDSYDVKLIVQFPPKLQSTRESHLEGPIEVKAGERKVLNCEAGGLPPPIVTWSKFDQPISFSSNVYLTETNELVIEKMTEHESGVYTCHATNALGQETRDFPLLVYSPPEIAPPGIEMELNVVEGQLVELPCVVAGTPPPDIIWLQNGKALKGSRKFADENGLRFVANITDFGDYTCFVTNSYGNISMTYNVYIWVAPHVERSTERRVDILIGSNTTLGCNAVGFPVPTILWTFKGEVLRENTTHVRFNDVGNLFITNASASHEGVYECIAENMAGVDRTFMFVRVNEPPTIFNDSYTGPYVATNMDMALSLPCKAAGKPKPYVMWAKDDRYLDMDARYTIDVDGTLTIKKPSEDLSGEYTCVAKNSVGNASKTITVNVYPLLSHMQSDESQSSVTLVAGLPATVQCPRSVDDSTVKWYKDAVLISNGTLKFSNVSRENASAYACVVTNAVASAYASVAVIVQWPPAFVENVLEEVEVVKDDDWYFDCKVDAKPRARVKWYFNSKQILGEDKDVLKLMNIQLHQTGVYKCVVSNDHGTVYRQFTLDVLVPPFISEFDLLDVQLKEGSNATLECDAQGSPAPDIKWTYNNTHWLPLNSTLSSSNITTASEGVFRCDATNKAGSTHLVYRVTVVSPARVVTVVAFRGGEGETVEKTLEVVFGTNIRIACEATGKPWASIQWMKHGNTISQNTEGISYADLELKNVDTSQAGEYSCFASNEGGFDERKIEIEVLEPPRIFQSLFQSSPSTNITTMEVISDQPFYLHCHVFGNPYPDVYWFKDEQPLRFYDDAMVTKDNGETVVSPHARLDQTGNYTCVARNRVGNTSVVYLVDVLVPPPQTKDTVRQAVGHAGGPLTLTCPAEGRPPPHVTWIRHPSDEITEDNPRYVMRDDGYTLIINETEVSDAGMYSCVITNKVGTTEVAFNVSVEKAPSIAGNVGGENVERHVVALMRSVVLKCDIDGHPEPEVTWLKDTQQLSPSVARPTRAGGSSLLTLWRVRARDAGLYICVAENRAGTALRRHKLLVKVPGKWSSWSQWSYCNVTCGTGAQTRSRYCHYIDDDNNTFDNNTLSDKIVLDESGCKGAIVDRRKCNMPPCEDEDSSARWSAWSRWSACSARCGAATQSRTRRCRTPAPTTTPTTTRCAGDNIQIRKCPNLPKCNITSDNTENNEILLNSRENRDVQNPYMPEAAFESQPEFVADHRSTDSDFFISPGAHQQMFYDVNVTENLDHSERGRCEPGYRHNASGDTCDDIDECTIENNQCHATQVCLNTLGGYRCTCQPGYVSLGAGQRCLDVNECEQGLSGCQYACVNVAGGYVCACPRALRLHRDRHHCVPPSSYKKPLSYEDLEEPEEYLSASIEFPTRHMKHSRN